MRVAVIGTGLIGGSVGLAARRRLGAEVRGVGPEAERAVEHGAADVACASIAEALDGAEIAFVATPLGMLARTVAEVLAAAGPDCVVTDVGSTKTAIVAAADDDPRFVGGHPLAGGEAAGVEHARADLFEGAVWYLTPGPSTTGVLFERLHRALVALGARPAAIDPDVHDRLMAAVSHLPHVIANVLVAQAFRAVDDGETLPATGPGFRDATRIAGANPPLWADILIANREALVAQIDEAVARLGEVRAALAAGDRDTVLRLQAAAHEERRALLETHLAGGPERELRVAVPNRPGVIAEIALKLGRAGINISDMALAPSPDDTQGEVTLWVAEADAERASAMLADR
ncbi:MAG: prephenate dehydrogenase/arogenate dehydrogenase family protein [Solirubrobacteraceae bacterium]|nr:prephenate dehydrogenase/arogenate dehydrogenase family protein [Solirubrobacteraceae bacterium]